MHTYSTHQLYTRRRYAEKILRVTNFRVHYMYKRQPHAHASQPFVKLRQRELQNMALEQRAQR